MAIDGIVTQARKAVKRHLEPGDVAVDATVGAGFDTLFMARQVGESGQVYGFDVQDEALDKARWRFAEEGVAERVTLFRRGHEDMAASLPPELHGQVKALMFNLGWLPGGDETITTRFETSRVAIEQALELVHPRGIVTVAIYSGHPAGQIEARELKVWAREVDYRRFRILSYEFINKTTNQETLLLIERV